MLQPSYSTQLDSDRKTTNNNALSSQNVLGLIGVDHENLSNFALKKIRKTSRDLIDKRLISYVLEKTGWNRTRATKILDISEGCLKIAGIGKNSNRGGHILPS